MALNLSSHLLPSVKKAQQKAQGDRVDESAVQSNTLEAEFVSRNKPERLEWLRDAGMGLFIHWSIDAQLGCVISHTLVGASKDYEDRFYEELPTTLEKGEWDFDHLASLAKLAGFKYAVLTTKHHCGFCLWPSKSTTFNVENTAIGEDLVKKYAEAFRKQGIAVGFYFSPEDFCFLRSQNMTITRTPVEAYSDEVMEKYREYLKIQMTELMTNFGKVDVLFFDGGETMVGKDGISLQRWCMDIAWDLQPDILITRGAIPTPEQQLPGVGADQAWEACITLGTAWQYQPTNETYKTGAHVIKLLVDTRAKGGSLLLNIGPDARGRLCEAQEGILRELALWHFINGECLHNTRPWVLTNEGENYLMKAKDGSSVYAVLFGEKEWKRGQRRELVLKSVEITENSEIFVMGISGELTEYRPDIDAHPYMEQKEDGLHLSILNAQRIYCGIDWFNPLVVKITDPKPAFLPLAVETLAEDQDIILSEGKAELSAKVLSMGSFDKAELHFDIRVYPGFALSSYEDGWETLPSREVTEEGIYSVTAEGLKAGVTYQCRAVLGNSKNEMKGELALFVAE